MGCAALNFAVLEFAHHLGAAVDRQGFVNILDVVAHRFQRDEILFGNTFISKAFGAGDQ